MAKFTKLSFCQNLFCAKFDEFPSLPVLKILNNQSVTAFSFFSLIKINLTLVLEFVC